MTQQEQLMQYKSKLPKFWKDVYILAEEYKYDRRTAIFLTRMALGDMPWIAYKAAWPEKSEGYKVVALKAKSDQIVRTDEAETFMKEVRDLCQRVYNMPEYTWDWSLKDSERTLRYMIDVSEETITAYGIVTPALSNALLQAVRELNRMYSIGGENVSLQLVKQVVFSGEELLED